MAYPNKYFGRCKTCQVKVPVGAGFVVKQGEKWITFCRDHVPEKIVAPAPTRRVLTKDGKVFTPYEAANLDLYRSMPGARWNKPEACWDVSLAPGDRARLLELADRLKLDVAAELRNVVLSESANNALSSGLYPFQVDGVDWLSKREKALLGDDMGLGKTIQSLMALEQEAAALCVCPATLKLNWADECRKWRKDLKPVVLEGRGTFRFPQPGEVVIVNFDILPDWLKPVKRTESSPNWDVEVRLPLATREAARKVTLIVDEAHKVKNWQTARAQRVKGLAMVCGKVWALTGTPLENRPMDLWGTLSALRFENTVFGTFPRFIERMNGVKGKFGGYEFGMPQPIVPELLRRVMLRRRREVVLPDLPRKTYTTVSCDLPKELQSEMDDLWNEWGEFIEDEKELPPFEEFSSVRAKLAASRVPQLEELVEDCEENDCPVVVFSAHLAPVEAMGKREGWATITGSTPNAKRHQVVADFQAGRLKGVALTIRAGGVGLTLTRAWKVIFCDLDWVPSQNQQAEDRLCRIGQTSNKVEVVRMVSSHVLDIHVLDLMAWKISVIEAALEKQIKTEIPVDPRLAYATAAMVAEAQANGINISGKKLAEIHAALQAAGVPQDCYLPQQASETEEQFAARLERARAFAEAAADGRDPSEVNATDSWLPLEKDKDIPF